MSFANVSSAAAPKAIGAYSPAILAGDTLYCSGQLGMDPVKSELVAGVREQTERALLNLEAVLAAADMGARNVVKTTIYLANIADFAAVNEVYSTHFSAPYPARATVQVAALPKDARVEIEAIAVKF